MHIDKYCLITVDIIIICYFKLSETENYEPLVLSIIYTKTKLII